MFRIPRDFLSQSYYRRLANGMIERRTLESAKGKDNQMVALLAEVWDDVIVRLHTCPPNPLLTLI